MKKIIAIDNQAQTFQQTFNDQARQFQINLQRVQQQWKDEQVTRQSVETQRDQLYNQLQTAETAGQNLGRQVHTLEAQLNNALLANSNLTNEIKNAQLQINIANLEVKSLNIHIAEREQQLTEMAHLKAQMQTEIDSLKTNLRESSNNEEFLRKQISDLKPSAPNPFNITPVPVNTELEKLREQHAEDMSFIKQLTQQLNKSTDNENALLAQEQGYLKKARQDITDLLRKNYEMSAELSTNRSRLVQAEIDLRSAEIQNAKLNRIIYNLQIEITNLRQQLASGFNAYTPPARDPNKKAKDLHAWYHNLGTKAAAGEIMTELLNMFNLACKPETLPKAIEIYEKWAPAHNKEIGALNSRITEKQREVAFAKNPKLAEKVRRRQLDDDARAQKMNMQARFGTGSVYMNSD